MDDAQSTHDTTRITNHKCFLNNPSITPVNSFKRNELRYEGTEEGGPEPRDKTKRGPISNVPHVDLHACGECTRDHEECMHTAITARDKDSSTLFSAGSFCNGSISKSGSDQDHSSVSRQTAVAYAMPANSIMVRVVAAAST